MSKYAKIKKTFKKIENKEQAALMSKYMRDMFSFYGLHRPVRQEVYRDFIKKEKKSGTIDWVFLEECWNDKHREFQYLACEYLSALRNFLKYEDIERIRKFVETKSWWDTIDSLCKIIGDISLRDKRVKDLMLEWSLDDNFWIRRTAIEHQLCLKETTDKELLSKIVKNNFGSEEFFINKAIGWALREYSNTNPDWVKNFIEINKNKMSRLSIKEGLKIINKKSSNN